MMYLCDNCGAEFDEPELSCSRENLDGENGYALVTEKFCPDCGAEEMYFEELEETEDG